MTAMQFELRHLDSYDDAALLKELCRVAVLVHRPMLSRTEFDRHGKVHSSTLGKRFGGWGGALQAAGLSDRVDRSATPYTREKLLEAMLSVATSLEATTLTLGQFRAHSGIDGGPVRRVFGSWKVALETAGLGQSSLARRYTDEECFENLLNLWMRYGRPPQHDEANESPSVVGSKAYVRRWGTWRKALSAFVTRANEPERGVIAPTHYARLPTIVAEDSVSRGPRDVPLALRYFILKRDRFRCVTCGRSPATDAGTVLHIDHIKPWVDGGATVAANFWVLCAHCNLGKGMAHADTV